MSGYILCQTKKAQRPYFIENISMNIYSIEELCYYLYHNLYLADHTVFNEELCNWLRDELELVHLAAKLKQNLERNVSVEEMIYPVFKEINYLTYEEMKGFNSRIVTYGKEKAAVRQKRKGDALTENGMYVNAIGYTRNSWKERICLSREKDSQLQCAIILAVHTVIFFRWKKHRNVFWKHTEKHIQKMP